MDATSSPSPVERAASAAGDAFRTRAMHDRATRVRILRAIAGELEADRAAITEAGVAESSLPLARLDGELDRTTAQLRLFADVVEAGHVVDARIDTGPPDVRRMLVPNGPVAVFGASNFPLAFSVPGGDTASALAAGCPVVVKAHPAHPRTSDLCAVAISAAVRALGLHSGVFSMIHGGIAAGEALVDHPEITAVGFTGSHPAGRALFDRAAARPVPIPVFAEMGSTNPVFVLPAARASRGHAIAAALAASTTLGVGQFCTNPGVVTGLGDDDVEQLAAAMAEVGPATMLTSSIGEAYAAGVGRRTGTDGVELVTGEAVPGVPALHRTAYATFAVDPGLREELFGPTTIVVDSADADEMLDLAQRLEGQLTATIFADPDDADLARTLSDVLSDKVGRLIWNEVPTGVAVNHAMQHGGPYPASTDGRSTSVGTSAMLRFCRPISFQGAPPAHLPPELADDNPCAIVRLVDGRLTTEPVGGHPS